MAKKMKINGRKLKDRAAPDDPAAVIFPARFQGSEKNSRVDDAAFFPLSRPRPCRFRRFTVIIKFTRPAVD